MVNDGEKSIGIILSVLLFRAGLVWWLMHTKGCRLPLDAVHLGYLNFIAVFV